MNCVFEANCVKAFGEAIHALSRIGDDMWLDPMVKGLAVRSVNSSHSAYACFLFSPLFFKQYSPDAAQARDRETLKCKLDFKSVLPLFRCLASTERNVERCQISINIPGDRVIFQFYCRHGIIKTHDLGFHESEALQAVFLSHLCPNVLKAPARLLGDTVMQFPVSQEEITLSMTPLRVDLRNHYEEESDDHTKTVYTEMTLHPSEFDYFQNGVDSNITFSLKELKGFMSFADSHSLPVSVHFGAAGSPVCFSVDNVVLEASLVLATPMNPERRDLSQTAAVQPITSLRCGDAVGPAEGSCEAVPLVTEMIASSQGSEPMSPAPSKRRVNAVEDFEKLGATDRGYASAITTPTFHKSHSLLFGALFVKQGEISCASMPQVLACSSDEEDDIGGGVQEP